MKDLFRLLRLSLRLSSPATIALLLPFVLAVLSVSPVSAQSSEYYAAPWGMSTGDGSINNPWDLATALNSNARGVKGGDTIWLRGGWYVGTFTSSLTGSAGSPIVVRQYPGERATIDRSGGAPYIDALYVTGSDVWYWGFEITDTDPRRTTLDNGSFPADLPRWNGVYSTAPNNKFINLVVHDLANGLAIYGADNTEVYGSIIYYNGWDAPDRGHGHGIYTQNKSGIRSVADNIIFGQLSHGIHAYGSGDAGLNNIQLIGNTSFNNGILTRLNPYYDRNILLGGGVLAENPVVDNNYTYYSPGGTHSGGDNNIGYGAGCTNLEAIGNYFGNVINSPLTLVNCSGTIRGNTFIGPLDANVLAYQDNTFGAGRPSGTRVFVRPNRYEIGRSNVTIFNWDGAATVAVDLAGTGLSNGDTFQIKDAENFYGDPVVAGTYTGAAVAIPMTNLTAVAPVGSGVTVPGHTSQEFGVFVVMRGTTGTLKQFQQPPPRPLPYAMTLSFLDQTRDIVGRGSRALVPDGAADGGFTVTLSGLPGAKTISKLELKLANNLGVWDTSNAGYWVAGVSTSPLGNLINGPDGSLHLDVDAATTLYLFAADAAGPSLFTKGSLWFANIYFTDGTMAAGHTTIDSIAVPAPPPPSSANTVTFLRSDASTQGSWKGVFGSEGYVIANDSANAPPYARLMFSQQSAWTWKASTSEIRATQKGGDTIDRLASCWFSTAAFTIDINMVDAAAHELALYSLDWDNQSRVQTIELVDAASAVVLDRRTVSAFAGGQYLVWRVAGHIIMRVTRTGPNSSAIAGLFFDPSATGAPTGPPNRPPSVTLISPATPTTAVAPATIALAATASDSDGSVSQVTFYSGASPIGDGALNGALYTFNWSNVVAGTYHISAKATDNVGASAVSSAVDVTVAAAAPPNIPPSVSLTSPAQGSTLVAPATVVLRANASDSDGSIAQVAFYSDSTPIATAVFDGSAYAFTWSGVPAGTYHVTARATDNSATATMSARVDFSVIPPSPSPANGSATAAFVRSDSTTQGNWRTAFGTDGYLLANESAHVPTYAQVAIVNQQSWTWTASTPAPQALQKSAATDRIAACWYSASVFSIDVNLSDGAVHQMAVYALDWDSLGRAQTIDILDASTGVPLDTRVVSGFASGQYFVWRLSGHLVVRVTRKGGSNAVLSGIFFDPSNAGGQTPTVTLTDPAASASFPAPVSIPLSATASEAGGAVNQVSFYSDNTLIGVGASSGGSYTLLWSNVSVGTHILTARATDAAGVSASSSPATITVTGAGGGDGLTRAAFVRTDDTMLGAWKGTFGTDGYLLANESTIPPAYAQVKLTDQLSWTWTPSTLDARAPQKGGSLTDRIAACWYSGSTFTVDVNITDGATHQVAIYAMDWDWVGRADTIDIVDAATGALLDTRTFSALQNGRYGIWRISGHVTFRVSRAGSSSAVVSGIFFDPAP